MKLNNMIDTIIALCVSATLLASCTSAAGDTSADDTSAGDATMDGVSPAAAAPTAPLPAGAEGNTIEYIVYLKPTDQTDPYAPELYEHFDRAAFADSIMSAIYYHRARVTDYQTGEPLTIDDIKTREVEDPNYARSKMAGVRFTEQWRFDPTTLTMAKRVTKMLVGYEVVSDSMIVALRPGFLFTFD